MKSVYLLLIGALVFLASCSSSYRSRQTADDVYYSPSSQDDGYVTVYNEDEQDTYNYQEDYEIRRGIRNPIYRNSISFSVALGNPFYYRGMYLSPFYDPFLGFGFPLAGYFPYGYGGYRQFAWGGFSPYYGYGAYSHGFGSYYNNYGYYGGGYYGGGYYGSGYGGLYNVTPRRANLNTYLNTGLRTSGNSNTRTIKSAPVRTLSPKNSQGSPIRRVFAPRNDSRTVNPSRSEDSRRHVPARSENNRRYVPSRSENQRRYTPPSRSESPSRYHTPSKSETPNYTPSRSQSPSYSPPSSPAPSRSVEPSRSPAPSRSSGNNGSAPRRS